VLVLVGWAGAATLLLLTFVAGCCTALLSPSWNSAIVDVVPRDELPQAITAVGISYNAARALGPTPRPAGLRARRQRLGLRAGGAGHAGAVPGRADATRRGRTRRRLPAERLWGGMLSALRFARHSETVLAQLVRTVAYSAAGSALWALLPVIAQRTWAWARRASVS
jgi:hypothetical protein